MYRNGLILVSFLCMCLAASMVARAEPVTIRWSAYAVNQSFLSNMEAVIEEFEALHPEIKVELEYGVSDYRNKLQVMFVSGSAPDVALVNFDYIPEMVAAGMFEELTPYLERDQIHRSDYIPLSIDTFTWQGGLWAAPIYVTGESFVVNADLFAESGLALPDLSWTWDSLVSAGKRLMRTESDGTVVQWGFVPWNGLQYGLASLIRSNGGDVISADGRESLVNQPEAVQAISFLSDIYNVHGLSLPTGLSMARHKIGMAQLGGYYAAELRRSAPDLNLQFAHPPAGPAGKRNLQLGANGWALLSSSQHKEEAWLLIKFLISERGQSIWSSMGIPALYSAAQSPEFREHWEGMNFDVYLQGVLEYGHDYYPTKNWTQWTQAANAELAPVWRGERSPEEGALRAHEVITQYLQQ